MLVLCSSAHSESQQLAVIEPGDNSHDTKTNQNHLEELQKGTMMLNY